MVNPRYARAVGLMAAYDGAKVGTEERVAAGASLDKEASRMSERDLIRAVSE